MTKAQFKKHVEDNYGDLMIGACKQFSEFTRRAKKMMPSLEQMCTEGKISKNAAKKVIVDFMVSSFKQTTDMPDECATWLAERTAEALDWKEE